VTGLRARGGFEIDLAWRDGVLERATIRSDRGNPCTVRSGSTTVRLELDPGQAITLDHTLRQR